MPMFPIRNLTSIAKRPPAIWLENLEAPPFTPMLVRVFVAPDTRLLTSLGVYGDTKFAKCTECQVEGRMVVCWNCGREEFVQVPSIIRPDMS